MIPQLHDQFTLHYRCQNCLEEYLFSGLIFQVFFKPLPKQRTGSRQRRTILGLCVIKMSLMELVFTTPCLNEAMRSFSWEKALKADKPGQLNICWAISHSTNRRENRYSSFFTAAAMDLCLWLINGGRIQNTLSQNTLGLFSFNANILREDPVQYCQKDL